MVSSPQELLDRLVGLFPEFSASWNDRGNYFRNDDGSFSFFGVFAEFSYFFRDYYEHFSRDWIAALGEFLSECMAVPNSELGTAAAACFLENVAAERFSADFKMYLRGEPLDYYSQWE